MSSTHQNSCSFFIDENSIGDDGHLYGNFPKYYTFHKSEERMKLLTKSAFSSSGCSSSCSSIVQSHEYKDEHTKNHDQHHGSSEDTNKHDKFRGRFRSSDSILGTIVHDYLSNRNKNDTYDSNVQYRYLDIGCNDGELTVLMARALLEMFAETILHQCQENQHHKKESSDTISLTSSKIYSVAIETTGYDIDSSLIEKARKKYGIKQQEIIKSNGFDSCNESDAVLQEEGVDGIKKDVEKGNNGSPPINKVDAVVVEKNLLTPRFEQMDIIMHAARDKNHPTTKCDDMKQMNAIETTKNEDDGNNTNTTRFVSICTESMERNYVTEQSSNNEQNNAEIDSSTTTTTTRTRDDLYDFISMLSTTMWIHIHGGDSGLENVLEWMCNHSRYFVLVEPQPSKCYKTAAIRYRSRQRRRRTSKDDCKNHDDTTTAATTNKRKWETVDMDRHSEGTSSMCAVDVAGGADVNQGETANRNTVSNLKLSKDDYSNDCSRTVDFPNVSLERLKYRVNINESIDTIMKRNGFDLVPSNKINETGTNNTDGVLVSATNSTTEQENKERLDSKDDMVIRTSWNRTFRLYRRRTPLL